MNRTTLILLLLFIGHISFAQRGTDPKPSDIAVAKKIKAALPSSEIISTNSSRLISFSYNEKLKGLVATESITDELLCTANSGKHVVYEFYNDQTDIKDITVKYRNGKKKELKINREYHSQEGIFYSDAKICYFSLDFPTQGYRYQSNITKEYNDIKYFTSVYLSKSHLIKEEEVVFTIPRWMKVKLVDMNFEGYDITVLKEYDEKKNADIIRYKLKDVPPMVREDNTKGPSHIYPHILVLSQSYEYNNKKVTLFNSTKDLYKWYRSLVKRIDNEEESAKVLAKEITKGVDNDIDKIKAIYYWVQDNIRYIAFEDGLAGFKPDESQNVLEKKYGDCKGMANLTKVLLKSLGYDARLTWIGTRRLAYDYSLPSLSVDNHMICTVFHEGKKYFLDATEEFNGLGEYAERIQGRQVLIENNDAFELSEVPKSDYAQNTLYLKKKLTIEEDNLVGAASYQYNGESKANFMYQLNHIEAGKLESALADYLTDGEKNYKISNIKNSDIGSRDGPLDINYEVSWEDAVSSFGDEIYLDLDFYKEFKQFKIEDRIQDYIFSYKISQTTEIELAIPSGYTIDYVPEDLLLEFDDFKFTISYKKLADKLIYKKQIAVKNAEIKKEDFELWNSCIDSLSKAYEEQIVIKRKS